MGLNEDLGDRENIGNASVTVARCRETETQHGPGDIYWDNLQQGFRIECFCDFITFPGKTVTEAAEEFDEHLSDYSRRYQ